MATTTYHGSCHCKKVTFEADIDLSKGTSKCNCSICWKIRSWNVLVPPAQFRLLSGEADLADYTFGTHQGHHLFCRHCGVRPFSRGDIPQLGGAFISIQLSSLDDLDPAELLAAPIHVADGRGNNWMNPPAEARHL